MKKIQIKSRWDGSVLFEFEKENNTLKDTLIEAFKKGAYLRGAYLRGADLRGAYLSGADLRGADLSGADLRGAREAPFIPFACPSEGSFIGWKKVYNYLVKLEIPEDARRCSATTTKCRCDKARVLSITHIETDEAVESVINGKYAEYG